jgi:hypothetical protein
MSQNGPVVDGLRPEFRLLLLCAAPRFVAAPLERVDSLLGQVSDWLFLFSAAGAHGVRMLFFRTLKAASYPHVPDEWKQLCEQGLQTQAEENLVFAVELARLLGLLETRGIQAVPCKGPVLALQAFGDLGLRDFGDLDILVRHRDIHSVVQLMREDGYTLQLPEQSRYAGDTKRAQVPGQYYFDRPPSFRPVEFHTEKTLRYYPVPLDLDRLQGRLASVRLGGWSASTFCPEDALTVLSVHGSKHLWNRLQWVADLAWLVRSAPEFSWDLAMQFARDLGAERMTLSGLALASELFSLDLPADIAARINSDPVLTKLVSQALTEMFAGEFASAGAAQRAMFRVRSMGASSSGLRYLFRLMTSPTEEDWESARGSRLRQMVMRPVRLIRKYGWGFGQRAARAQARKTGDDPAHKVA